METYSLFNQTYYLIIRQTYLQTARPPRHIVYASRLQGRNCSALSKQCNVLRCKIIKENRSVNDIQNVWKHSGPGGRGVV